MKIFHDFAHIHQHNRNKIKQSRVSCKESTNINVTVRYKLCPVLSGQSQTVTPSQTIITLVGEDVILPCHLEPRSDAVSEIVEWGRPDLDPRFVHVWFEGQDHLVNQNPSYKGRTSLSTEKLKQGDLSLKLTRVKHSDNGRYRCYFPSEHKESIIELLVGKWTFFSTLWDTDWWQIKGKTLTHSKVILIKMSLYMPWGAFGCIVTWNCCS